MKTLIQLLTLHIFAVLLLTSCAGTAPTKSPEASRTAADNDTIIAALTHFHSLPGEWRYYLKDILLLHHGYETSTGFISASQLRTDLYREQWAVPEDARLEIERRTLAKETLVISNLPPFIRIVDFAAPRANEDGGILDEHPDAKNAITLYPPGYTQDRTRAIVRFLFVSTHGASAIYLLEFRAGRWHVVRHHLSYYA